MVEFMRRARAGTNAKFAAEPGFFDTLPEVIEANALLPQGALRWTMRKPADLADFVVNAIVMPARGAQRTERVFAAVGVEPDQANRLQAAVNAFTAIMSTTLIEQPEAKAACSGCSGHHGRPLATLPGPPTRQRALPLSAHSRPRRRGTSGGEQRSAGRRAGGHLEREKKL
jgi:hypothetical protein